MNCESVRQIINEYIDGELNELESRRVELHIAACESCAREERQLRIVCDLVGKCGIQKAPEGLLNGIHIELSKQLPLRKKRSYVGILALAASFMIALAGGHYFNVFDIQYEHSAPKHMVADAGNMKLKNDSTNGKPTVAINPAKTEDMKPVVAIEPAIYEAAASSVPETIVAQERSGVPAAPRPGETTRMADMQRHPSVESEPETSSNSDNFDITPEIMLATAPSLSTENSYEESSISVESNNKSSYELSMYENMNESDRARADMVRAIDDMEQGEIVYDTSRFSSGYAANPSTRYAPAVARARTHELSAVSYNNTPAFEYYEAPSDTDVINYVISRNIDELRRTRGKEIYARGKNVFLVKNPIASSVACEQIITESLRNESTVTLQRKDNFIVVKGKFVELMPLRINILDKCSEDTADFTQEQRNQLIAAATSTFQFSPDQPTILEIQFKQ